MRYVALDSETTGINFEKDRIVELAMVEIVDGVIGKTYQTYLNPGVPSSLEAQAVHNIDPQIVANAPAFIDVVDDVFAFIDGSTIVAHFADFDAAFLGRECRIAQPNHYVSITTVCTRNLAKKLWPAMSCKLSNVCAKLDIEFDKNQAHGALYDATKCAEAFIKLSKLHGTPL